jgi:hypothetical protein
MKASELLILTNMLAKILSDIDDLKQMMTDVVMDSVEYKEEE